MNIRETWNGFICEKFEFDGKEAKVVFPHEENKTNKWLLKTEYFGAFPTLEIEMLKKGYHVAHVANITRWCKEEDTDRRAAFARFLSEKYGLNRKCVPVGMSCGGMQGVYFAAKHPDMVSALYLDAPVINLLSCPAGLGIGESSQLFSEFQDAMGMSISELIGYRGHPLDKIGLLLENNIPVILVCGDADTLVPYVENGKLLNDAYVKAGGTIKTIIKPGCGHHPHGLADNTPIIDFILKYDS